MKFLLGNFSFSCANAKLFFMGGIVCLLVAFPKSNARAQDDAANKPAIKPVASQTDSVSPSNHKLSIGDRISFRIAEDQDDPKSLLVTDSGDIEVPYIGRVQAQNKTCAQLAKEIKTTLEKDYYYHATVTIAVDLMTKTEGRVYLVGAVRTTGPVEIPNDELLTLSKAILRAGGFTDFADTKHIKVTRKTSSDESKKETFTVNVGDIFDKGKIELDMTLKPGDLIYVPERLVRF
jgi:polysaccharide export outer membrane protein